MPLSRFKAGASGYNADMSLAQPHILLLSHENRWPGHTDIVGLLLRLLVKGHTTSQKTFLFPSRPVQVTALLLRSNTLCPRTVHRSSQDRVTGCLEWSLSRLPSAIPFDWWTVQDTHTLQLPPLPSYLPIFHDQFLTSFDVKCVCSRNSLDTQHRVRIQLHDPVSVRSDKELRLASQSRATAR